MPELLETDDLRRNDILRNWLRGCFLPYQLKWILDTNAIALAVKGRQMGFTDASAGRCILGGFRDGRPQIVLSAAQDNANLLLDAVRTHCAFLAKIGLPEAINFATNNTEEIVWRSGGSVTAIAANPRTARSYHGDLTFDEAAYYLDPDAMWAAAAPMITRGDWRFRVFSTPNGATGRFYDLCKAPPPGWGFHHVSLDDAERDGLVVDRAKLLSLVNGDQRMFAEAYLCDFLDADLQYFPSKVVDRAIHWRGDPPDFSNAEFFAGLDIGRHHDLTVLTIVAVLEGVAWVVAVLTAKRTAFKAQRRMVFEARERIGWDRIAVDKGGLGEQFTEELLEEWGEDEVLPVAFTMPSKSLLATGAFGWFQRGHVRLPRGPQGRRIHDEVCAVRRLVTKNSNVIFESPKTKDGHGDHAWSLFLALQAASGPALPRGMGDGPLLAVA